MKPSHRIARALFTVALTFGGAIFGSGACRGVDETPMPATTAPATASIADAGKLKDLDGHFPFAVPDSKESWDQRAVAVKRQVEVALGLIPKPKLAALKPVVHSPIKMRGYTVEKVYFESLPGFYVTGNLYRPENLPAGSKVPAVLCPHGHWANARFYEASPGEVRNLLASGAERFENAARNHIQARCVQLARMGCVVFHWDMIGYCDSQQINFDRSHRFAKQDPATEVTDEGWLLFSPKAEELGQSVMGLQTINTVQSLEFVLSLPEVDASRVAITGASGGGTQTFIAAALDPRFAVAFPAVMVSTSMQGGCTCENACGLRIDTGNVEISGLIAPRPLGMTAANDWTRNMASDGFPQLQKLYEMFGKRDNVALFPATHYDHNYNHVARVAMYGWVNKFFGLGKPTPVLEEDFDLLLGKDLTVWDANHPQPESGEGFERKLMKLWDAQAKEEIAADKSHQTLRDGWKGLLGPELAQFAGAKVTWERPTGEATGTVEHPKLLAPLLVSKKDGKESSAAVIVVGNLSSDEAGKYDAWGKYQPNLVGDVTDPATGLKTFAKEQPLVANPRLAAAYTYGYNWPTRTKRIHQVLALIAALRAQGVQKIAVAGSDAWTMAGVKLQSGEAIEPVSLKLTSSDFETATSIRSFNFVPGSQRYLGLIGLIVASEAGVNEAGVKGGDAGYARVEFESAELSHKVQQSLLPWSFQSSAILSK